MDQNTNEQPLKRRTVLMPLLVCLLLGVGFVVGSGVDKFLPGFSGAVSSSDSLSNNPISEVLRFINAKYVDKLSSKKLEEEAINNLLLQLDPHSVYIPKEEIKEVNDDMSGDFEGIGIEYLLIQDTIVVMSTIPGGPSDLIGLRAGDKIVSINDTAVYKFKLESHDVTKKLRGSKGTKVKLGIVRTATKGIIEFNVKRDQIPLNSIDAAYQVDATTAYIKINRFSSKTYEEFMGAMDSLFNKMKLQNLILDLRQNPGGYLQEATNILSQLIQERSKLLVYTKGRNHNKTEYETNGRFHFDIKKIAVLIDEGSASASEIVAGAIQDWDRGVIIGRRSFGKGLVQEQFELSDGGALRLTVAKYYTPSGRCIQKSYSDHANYENDLENRLKNGELINGSKAMKSDTTKYYTSKGRLVFGSGGISPDIFVPADTILFSQDFLQFRQFVAEYALDWIGKNKSSIPTGLSAFVGKFTVSDAQLNEFMDYTKSRGLSNKQINLMKIYPDLKRFLKARIARQLYGDKGYYQVMNNEDKCYLKAIERLKLAKPIPF